MSGPLTVSEAKVLERLSDRYNSEMNCLSSGFIASLTDLTLLQARRAVKSLVRRGYAELIRGVFNDEGQICGSGYCCTRKGREAPQGLHPSLTHQPTGAQRKE